MERKLAELKQALANTGDRQFIGGRLSSIQTEGLPATILQQLQSRLPVHLGDEINAEVIRKVEEALQSIDPRLHLRWERGERGDVALSVAMETENE